MVTCSGATLDFNDVKGLFSPAIWGSYPTTHTQTSLRRGFFMPGARYMAFDRTNQAHLQAWRDEVDNDPLALGLAAALAAGTDNMLDLMNLPENNPGAETGVPQLTAKGLMLAIARNPIPTADMTTVQGFMTANGDQLDMSWARGTDDPGGEGLRNLDAGMKNEIDAMTRPLSRAEVLFTGVDQYGSHDVVTLTRADWAAVVENT